jgi:hypothetical protein
MATITPYEGAIYELEIELEKILNRHKFSISEISSSSSSCSSSTTSVPPKENKNQSQGKRRFCLVWEILQQTIKVLPVVSFGNRILSNSNITSHLSSSNKFFLKRVLSIAPTPLHRTKDHYIK